MREVNFLPETLKSKHKLKKVEKKAFVLSTVFLMLVLVAGFSAVSYKAHVNSKVKKVEQRLKTEETAIQSLKNTEGVYRSLKIKAGQLAEILTEQTNYPDKLEEIRKMGGDSNVSIEQYSFDSKQNLEVTGSAPSLVDLVSFLKQLTANRKTLKLKAIALTNINQDYEKGLVQFSVSALSSADLSQVKSGLKPN